MYNGTFKMMLLAFLLYRGKSKQWEVLLQKKIKTLTLRKTEVQYKRDISQINLLFFIGLCSNVSKSCDDAGICVADSIGSIGNVGVSNEMDKK